MRLTATIALLASAPALVLGMTACNPAIKSTTPAIDVVMPIIQTEMVCPICGEPVTELDEAAYFESYPVYCKGRENARQFASLELKQRARLGADQVLPQKGITNRTCPLTGEALDARAAAVTYEGTVIGFSTAADANQFRSLKAERKAKVIAQWKAEQAG
jgi:hypothetical protein